MTAFSYQDQGAECEGYVALPQASGPRPAVLVVHNWAGQGPFDNAVADKLAALGYVGIAVDVFGKGTRGDHAADNSALIAPWGGNRAALRQRLLAAVDAAAAHPAVDGDRIAAIGFCFGGMCALDLARSADPRVKGAVSFHGVYGTPNLGEQLPITAKVLVLHGWEDPFTPPEAHNGLAKELTEAGADWQIHAYGHAHHSFTNPHANNPAGGQAYNAAADRRSWAATVAFLQEALAG
ncbi:dienelactone hydrolase family protein [Polymorphobacter sp.]|uniref:dienelactone hydrolase family protein n=1 Tax=Polymorphobacter sp. TaxID=1909290 RepID=UPI003F721381